MTAPSPAVGTTAQRAQTTVGRSVLRKEDEPLLRGQGAFVDDLRKRGVLDAAFLRSPYPHARILSIDSSAALALAGVVDVITAADLPDRGPQIPMRMFVREGMERFLQRPLADDRVRYIGEPVAVVVAESRYIAEDALELIEVAYEPLPAVVDHELALAGDAPILHESAGTNLATQWEIGPSQEVQAIFTEAAHVVEAALSCARQGAVPMEPRGMIAFLEEGSGRLVVQGAAKLVHINRRILASMLGWDESRIRFVESDVGGGFGARGEFYPEDYLIPFCAIRLGRAVAWTEDREEHLRTSNHSRDQHYRLGVALDDDGRFLAFRAEIVMNTGAYIRTHGSVVPGMASGLLPGPYAWPAFACTVRQVVTNKTPSGTYRAPGRYEGTFARERLIDIAAHKLGIECNELRARNLVTPAQMPWPNGSHTDGHPVVYDSGDYPLLLEKTLAAFDYAGMRAWSQEPLADAPARRRGTSLVFFVEKSGIAHWEYGRVELAADGSAKVFTGSASLGQGLETVLAQICADHLGVAYEDVTVHHGDTDEVPEGMGSFGSRATSLGGAAVAQAADAIRERLGAGAEPPLSAEARFESDEMSFPYGVHCAAVEVDTETGAVEIKSYGVAYDVGRAINPQLITGQIVGGFAQGLGGALLEELAYDEGGQLIASTFIDYLLPTSHEMPLVQSLIPEDAPTQRSPIGAKGAGEGGTSAAGAAIASAVSDAIGAEVTRIPITPQWVVDNARRSGAA